MMLLDHEEEKSRVHTQCMADYLSVKCPVCYKVSRLDLPSEFEGKQAVPGEEISAEDIEEDEAARRTREEIEEFLRKAHEQSQ